MWAAQKLEVDGSSQVNCVEKDTFQCLVEVLYLRVEHSVSIGMDTETAPTYLVTRQASISWRALHLEPYYPTRAHYLAGTPCDHYRLRSTPVFL